MKDELLVRAHELITEAMWTHIYDTSCGEKPNANCEYARWLNDVEKYLNEEEVA